MPLNGRLFAQFQDALLDAFPNYGDLGRMVRFKLNENLARIASSGDLNDVVFGLIGWAEARGRTDDLLRGAREDNPGNAMLIAFEAAYRAAGGTGATPPPGPGAPPVATGPGPVPIISPLTPALRLELVDAVLQLPVAADYVGRSSFLQGVPAAVTRSYDPRTDLNTMFDQLNGLGRLVSGQWPLLVVIDNILPFTMGWQAHSVVQRVRQTLAQAYGVQ